METQEKKYFFHEGTKSAKICIVGEAPDDQDIITGRPFSGSMGQLFDQCLHAAGIARSECYITYLIKEKGGSWGDLSSFHTPKGFSGRGQKYVQELKEELSDCTANVYVPMGNAAISALTGIHSVAKYRGSILSGTLLPDTKVIPTISPLSAMREYLFKYYIISDLRRIRTECMFPQIVRTERDLVIDPSFDMAMSFLEYIKKEKPRIAHDIEVVNLELSCFSMATSPISCMCIPFHYRNRQHRWSDAEEIMLYKLYVDILEDREIDKIGQNYMFDMSFQLKKNNIITRGKIDDTMIAHHVTYYDFPKALDFLCSIYAKEPYYKDDGKLWKNPTLSNEQFWLYCAKDSALTFESMLSIEKEMDKHGTRATYDFTMSLYDPLLYMQLRGIKADRERLEEAKKSVRAKIDSLQKELNEKAGMVLNVSSPKQCAEFFYIKKGQKPIISRKTGNVTTDDKAMTKLARKGVKEAYLVQEIRGLSKLAGTYLDMEFDSDSRLRCSYNAAGTTTGRLSSSQTIFGTGANFQNIPPEFKTFLVADPGKILLEFDKRQAEWIVVAFLSNDANMIAVVEKGLDAHITTGILMFNAPAELIKKEDEIIGNTTDDTLIRQLREEQIPEIFKYNPVSSMSCRQAAKKSNHGLNYDLGAQGFADANKVELEVGKKCHMLYHRAYPSLKMWHANIVSELGKPSRSLTTCFGRKRIFLDRWGDDLFKAAYAYKPQSTVGDNTNIGIVLAHASQPGADPGSLELLKKGLPERYADWINTVFSKEEYMHTFDSMGQVHDSYLGQYPVSDLDGMVEACIKIKKYMEPTLHYSGRDFVIPTDLKIGTSWGGMIKVKLVEDRVELRKNLEAAITKLGG